MDRNEFARRFQAALRAAAEDADRSLERPVPRRFRIRLHGAGHSGDLIDPERALNALYLGPDLSYRIIDVGATEVGREHTTIFVRASQHDPAPYDRAWNDPPGCGPFKQLGAVDVRVSDS
jgi:hypothetical protein